jgi:hypothetical protein
MAAVGQAIGFPATLTTGAQGPSLTVSEQTGPVLTTTSRSALLTTS